MAESTTQLCKGKEREKEEGKKEGKEELVSKLIRMNSDGSFHATSVIFNGSGNSQAPARRAGRYKVADQFTPPCTDKQRQEVCRSRVLFYKGCSGRRNSTYTEELAEGLWNFPVCADPAETTIKPNSKLCSFISRFLFKPNLLLVTLSPCRFGTTALQPKFPQAGRTHFHL